MHVLYKDNLKITKMVNYYRFGNFNKKTVLKYASKNLFQLIHTLHKIIK